MQDEPFQNPLFFSFFLFCISTLTFPLYFASDFSVSWMQWSSVCLTRVAYGTTASSSPTGQRSSPRRTLSSWRVCSSLLDVLSFPCPSILFLPFSHCTLSVLVPAFSQVLSGLWDVNEGDTVVNPRQFYSIFKEAVPHFSGYRWEYFFFSRLTASTCRQHHCGANANTNDFVYLWRQTQKQSSSMLYMQCNMQSTSILFQGQEKREHFHLTFYLATSRDAAFWFHSWGMYRSSYPYQWH